MRALTFNENYMNQNDTTIIILWFFFAIFLCQHLQHKLLNCRKGKSKGISLEREGLIIQEVFRWFISVLSGSMIWYFYDRSL